MTAPLHARGDGASCIRCRRAFKAGDRMQSVHIVQGLGRDPNNPRQPGLLISPEFEMVHVMCEDPELNGGVIVSGALISGSSK